MPDKVVSLALPLKESACPGICVLIQHACCRDGVMGEMLFHGQIIQGYPAGTRMRLQPGADLLRAAFACGDAADDALRDARGGRAAEKRPMDKRRSRKRSGRSGRRMRCTAARAATSPVHRSRNTACTCQDRHAEGADHQSVWHRFGVLQYRAAALAAIPRRSRER